MASARERYGKAFATFNSFQPGDRVRIVEEFTIESVEDGVLYYEGDPDVLPPFSGGWEYWPTEHITQAIVLRTADGLVVNS